MITRVTTNIKGGAGVQLGPKTLIIGENGAGKSTIVNGIEFALTGAVSDVAGRAVTAEAGLLKTLARGEVNATIERDDGTAVSRAGRFVTGDPGHLPLPLRELREAVVGTPQRAQRFILDVLSAKITQEAVLSKLPVSVHATYQGIAQGATAVEQLTNARTAAGKQARDLKKEADGADKMLDAMPRVSTQPLPEAQRLQEEAAVQHFKTNATRLRGEIHSAETRASSDQIRARRDALLIANSTIATQHQLYSEALAQLPPPDQGTWRDTFSNFESMERILNVQPKQPDCLLCGDIHTPEHYEQRSQAFHTALQLLKARISTNQQIEQKRLELSQQLHLLEKEFRRNETELATLAPQLQYEPDPAELDAKREELRLLEDALSGLEKALEVDREARANWSQVQALREKAHNMRGTAAVFKQLQDALDDAISELVDGSLAQIEAATQALLPPTDVFKIQLEPFRFGLVRNGDFHVALSGAEWVRVITALCAAISPDGIIIPEDRAFTPKTLQATMEALLSTPAQVILVSPEPPSRPVPGWDVIHVGAGGAKAISP
jgi:hypothetical protein